MTTCSCEMCQVLCATILCEPKDAVSPDAIQEWLDIPRLIRPPLWEWQRARAAQAKERLSESRA